MRTASHPLLRPLLLIQTGLLAVNALEASFFGAVGFATPVPALLTWTAVVMIGDAARRGVYPRRFRVTERILIGFGLIDTAISLFLASQLLEPMAILSRFIIPIVALRLAKRSVDEAEAPVLEMAA